MAMGRIVRVMYFHHVMYSRRSAPRTPSLCRPSLYAGVRRRAHSLSPSGHQRATPNCWARAAS